MVLSFFEGLVMGLGGLEACLGDLGAGLGDLVWLLRAAGWLTFWERSGRGLLEQAGVRVDKGVRMMLVGEKFVLKLVEVIRFEI